MSRKMKDSGVAWIGDIPEKWRTANVGQIFSHVKDDNRDLKELNLLSLSYGKIIRKNITSNYGLLPASFDNYNIIKARDIVMRLTDLQNDQKSLRTGIARERGIITSAYVTIRIKGDEDATFLHYSVHACDISKVFYGMGEGVRQSLNWKDIRSLQISFPEIIEQKLISDFLDAKCAEIDKVVEKTRESIEEYKKLKQAVITEAVTKGVRGPRPMKPSGVEWIGDIPEEWGTRKIGSIVRVYNGDRSGKYPKATDLMSSGVPFLTSANLNGDLLDISNTKYISEEKYASLGGAKVKYDDIIYCLRGSIGKCAINKCIACGTVASSLAVIRPVEVYPMYLLYVLLSSSVQIQTAMYMNGTCAANLAAESVKQHKIPYALNISEQQEIADYLDAKCGEIDRLISKKEQLITELETYKKSLIYEYVTGKKEVPA